MRQVCIHCERGDISVVAILQLEYPTVSLVRLVPAVSDLVTPTTELNALAVTTGELGLGAPGQLQRHVVRSAIVTAWGISNVLEIFEMFF